MIATTSGRPTTAPFARGDLVALRADAPAVVRRLFPDYEAIYAQRGWRMFPSIERVYDNARAREELGWSPRYHANRITYRHHCVLGHIRSGWEQ